MSVTYSLVTPMKYCFCDFQMHTTRDFVQTPSSPSTAELCKHLYFLYGLHFLLPDMFMYRTCYKTSSGIVNTYHHLALRP